MFTYIEFRSKRLRRLQLNIKPEIDFGIVLGVLEEVQNSSEPRLMGHIRFALLELVNNSLRAHRSRQNSSDISIDFRIVEHIREVNNDGSAKTGLSIVLEDSGGGFDPADLPYNIFAPLDNIDLQSESFQLYREMHNQQRFGMGLFVTRRTFDSFKLEFIDHYGNAGVYSPDDIRGTRISLIHWGSKSESIS